MLDDHRLILHLQQLLSKPRLLMLLAGELPHGFVIPYGLALQKLLPLFKLVLVIKLFYPLLRKRLGEEVVQGIRRDHVQEVGEAAFEL